MLVTHDLREAAFLSDTVFVLSPSPGRIVHVHRVDLPWPRALSDCDGPAATAMVAAMREQIRRREPSLRREPTTETLHG